ncbi:hypothetical protein BJX76DRAFT_27967 [Aspergillus varians]
MSVVANRPESTSTSQTGITDQSQAIHCYPDSGYGSVSIASRSPSLSSFKSNYSASTAPTSYSPTSSGSYRTCDSAASLDRILESVFKRIPHEVYENILNQLQYLHAGPGQSGCMTCFQRDLHALSLTCRPWEKAVRGRLYNHIDIIGSDSPAQLKKYRLKRGSRLKLLRRTLRERKLLANLVLELRVPQIDLLFTTGKHTGGQLQEYRDLVASVVMVCPNLERLLGLTIPFNHEFDRLTHALSTRRKLKEHTWILCEATQTSEASPRSTSCPGSLGPLQMFEFLDYHTSWTNLETLMLYGLSQTALEPSVFLRMLNLLPSLHNLCISNFDADAFADSALLCLPSLETLRLENLPGVTDAGLTQYTSRPESLALKSLVLIEPNIDSLLVISKILASLRSLERLKIEQTEKCPTLNSDGIIFQPLLASPSLKYLHWDVACPNPSTALTRLDFAPFAKPLQHVETPNSHLAQSILAGGFPHLDALRAPSDIEPPGALQAVCQPIPRGQALLQPDRFSLPRSSHGSIPTRPMALPGVNNMTSARIRAQTFIDMATRDTETGMQVLITDHSDSFVPDSALEASEDEAEMELDETGIWETRQDRPRANPVPEDHEGPVTVFDFRMPAYMGRTGSKTSEKDISIPRFILHPDIVGQDADGGLISWKHILAANQSLTFAAGVGVNFFGGKGVSSPIIDEPLSPTSTATTPRFGWGSIASRSAMATSPITPTTPTTPLTPMSISPTAAPPWEKDVCTGSWNYSHKSGRDWWFHMERERPVMAELYDIKRLF